MSASTYKTSAPAKINILLKVTGRRADGYHELLSIMVPISLFDYLEFEVIPGEIRLACEGGYPVPDDQDNLVHQAAALFLSRAGIQKGISIKLDKKIPVAAGLGGGSSDAASTLLSLNAIWSQPFDLTELHRMAVQLGADVPFFLECRPSLARGIGEILDPFEEWPGFWYLVVTPAFQVSTSWVYENLKLKLTSSEYDYIFTCLQGNFKISQLLENDLEKVTSASYPVIETIKNLLMKRGAEGALMSGSGPSVFGVFISWERAESAKKFLISQNLGDVFMARDWRRI